MTRYSNLHVEHPMWLPTAIKAAQQGNGQALYRPPGYESCSYTVNHMARKDGMIRWTLSYRFGDGKNTTVASWLTDWLPPEKTDKRVKPVIAPASPVRITSCGCDYFVRVVVDALGLPVPVPVEAVS